MGWFVHRNIPRIVLTRIAVTPINVNLNNFFMINMPYSEFPNNSLLSKKTDLRNDKNCTLAQRGFAAKDERSRSEI